jgi:hypothetical protein
MEWKPKHDKAGDGFDVDPELLAHDLTILKLFKTLNIKADTSEYEIYDAYTKELRGFVATVGDKTRYDENFK